MTTETEHERVLRLTKAAGFNRALNTNFICPPLICTIQDFTERLSKLIELTRAEALEDAQLAVIRATLKYIGKEKMREFDIDPQEILNSLNNATI